MPPRVRAMTGVVAVSLIVCTSAAEPAPAPPKRVIELDDRPVEPMPVPVAGLASPELVRIGRWVIFDAGEPVARFRSDSKRRRLLLADREGRFRVAAMTLGSDDPAALDGVSDADLAGLRSLGLDGWDDRIAAAVAKINPDCLVIVRPGASVKVGGRSALPPLPAGLRRVVIVGSVSPGVRDYSALQRMHDLRDLLVQTMDGSLDAGLISGAAELRRLAVSMPGPLGNPARLAGLRKLRALELRTPGLSDIGFAADLADLVLLDLRGTEVTDLSLLAGLQRLEEIRADGAPVSRLPERPMPALKTITAFGTGLTAAAAAGFAKVNPNCRLQWSWEAPLREALAGAQSVRIRSGGTCHRNPDREKTLFEEKDPAKVAELIAALSLDEPASGFECMCCGDPSLEFFRDGKLILTLGVHHGHGVRWAGGPWPGDAKLAEAAAERVCEWLAARKADGPLRERREELRRRETARRRDAAYAAILPAGTTERLREARSEAQAVATLAAALPDPTARCTAVLRMLGWADTSWDTYSDLEFLLRDKLMDGIPAEARAAALTSAARADAATVPGRESLTGAARWLFGEGRLAKLDDPTRATVLPAVGRWALADPRPFNRRRALQVIGADPSGEAAALLRAALAGEIAPRRAEGSDDGDAGGTREFRPGDPRGEGEVADDRVRAAVLLSSRGDRASLPAMRALLAALKPADPDRPALEKAVAGLEKPDPRKR